MKKAILFLLSLALTAGLPAQDLVIEPNPTVVMGVTADQFEGVGYATITNQTEDTLTLVWERNVLDITDGWASAICDRNLCHFPSVGSEVFEAPPNEALRLDVHVYPQGVAGSAVVEVKVYDQNDESTATTGLYYFNTEPSSTTTEVARDRFRVYPNPTPGLFSVSGGQLAERIEVYSLTGKRVASFASVLDNQYDIRRLPRGSYLVQLVGENGRIVATKLIQKI